MTGPAEPVFPVPGTEDVPAHASPFGHPRRGLRAIPRFPLSLAEKEALAIAFGPGSSAHPLQVSGTSPVPEGGIKAPPA